MKDQLGSANQLNSQWGVDGTLYNDYIGMLRPKGLGFHELREIKG